MTSIPERMWRIYGNNFKRHYLKNKRLFLIFYCISEMCMKFSTFSKKKKKKKNEYPSLIISEVIDAERRGFLNV